LYQHTDKQQTIKTKRQKRKKDPQLSDLRQALLVTTLQSNVLRLDAYDKFEGRQVIDVQEPVIHDFGISQIGEEEKELQMDVVHLWGEKKKKPRDQDSSSVHKALVRPILAYDKYVITKKSSKKDKEASRLTIGGSEVAMEGNETTPGAMTSKQVLEEIRRDLDAFPNAWRSVRVCVILRCVWDEIVRNPTVKILIFDRSLRTLEVIRFALEKNHYKCLQFDGDTKPADRAKRIGQFCDRNEAIKQPWGWTH
jgi:hypothetical protein